MSELQVLLSADELQFLQACYEQYGQEQPSLEDFIHSTFREVFVQIEQDLGGTHGRLMT
jgi:hypothetical protein